jgi:AraC-like DNA-binding protein
MNRLDVIAGAIDAIEARLCEPLAVAQMADLAAYSLYYFCRAFSKSTRHSPHDYLIRRRLSAAAYDLIDSRCQIADIAFTYQFASHEGFTRAFGRVFGTTPIEARRQGQVLRWRCMPRLSLDHLRCLQQQSYLSPVIEELPARSAAMQHIRLPPAYSRMCPLETDLQIDVLPSDFQPARRYACFTLNDAGGDLALISEWILHSWLFFAPYHSEATHMLLVPIDAGQVQLYLPLALPNSSACNSDSASSPSVAGTLPAT